MKTIKEAQDTFYTKVLLGGSIGEKPISSVRQLKGISFKTGQKFETSDICKDSCKISNKNLSPGEKKYYNLKWVCAEVVNGKYTGN